MPLISVKTPPALVIIGSFGLLFSRAVAVFLVSFICNLITREKINISSQIIVWFSGLRGAVAFYLAVNTTTENRGEILASTLWLILISITVLGLLTPVVLKLLDKMFPYDRIIVSEIERDEVPDTPSLSTADARIDRSESSDGEMLVSKFNYYDATFARS